MKKLIKLSGEELEQKSKEQTLVLCKPESMVIGLYPKILLRIQELHYKTPLVKLFQFNGKSITEFYESVIEQWEPRKDILKIFMKMTENPSLAVVVEGPNSVYSMRKLAGGLPEYKLEGKNVVFEKYSAQFQPLIAPMGTIRGDYSASDIAIPDTTLVPVPNFMHASASTEDYKKEIKVLLRHHHISKNDFIPYSRPDWKILFGVD